MKLTQNDIDYLRQGATQRGYNADDLLKIINYESSGRPDVWGGKNNNYYGIIQFGGPERAKYGVDTVHPSAKNQIDATFRFLADRGFKPGMGLLDAYSTVNAGSPGHYKASDGNGTVASHVAAMMGQKPVAPSSAPAVPASPLAGQMAYAAQEQQAPTSIEEIIQQQPKPQTSIPAGLLGLRQAMLNDEQDKAEYDDEMKRQMKALHEQVHQASIAGLLGGGM